ncbi:MAG: hypothetical protein AAGF07_02795 [Patescibacteria group bacterium]
MITKSELLYYIRDFSTRGELTRDELSDLVGHLPLQKPVKAKLNFFRISSILSWLIIYVGVVLLVYLNWNVYSSLMQISIIFGAGFFSFILGLLALHYLKFKFIGWSMHVFAAILLPLGSVTWLLNLVAQETSTLVLMLLVYLTFALGYALIYLFIRQAVILFFTWIFASIAYWSGFFWILNNNTSAFVDYTLVGISALLLSLGYILISLGLKQYRRTSSTFAYTLGTLSFLGSTFYLVSDYPTVESLFIFLLFCSFSSIFYGALSYYYV